MPNAQLFLFENEWDAYTDCAHCEDRVKEDDSTEVNGSLYCPDCLDECFVRCERCSDYADSDDTTEVRVSGRYSEYRDSEVWCNNCADNESFRRDDCGDSCEDSGRVVTTGGSEICRSCYDDGYFHCDGCGDVYHSDDMGYSTDGCYCRDCGRNEGNFCPTGFRSRGKMTIVGSARKFGIEIETNACDGYYDLEGSGAWGAKDDCTVNGKEFYSDILSGDDGLDAVMEFARIADRNGWAVGTNCGYHLHLDMRGECDDSLYAITYAFRAAQDVFFGLTESHRHSGTYSRACEWGLDDIDADDDFRYWAGRWTRYNWLNCAAYTVHGTIEVRLHEATCDGYAICNWVKACTRFADWAATVGLDGVRDILGGMDTAEMFDFIAREAWQDDALRTYYADKARRLYGYEW